MGADPNSQKNYNTRTGDPLRNVLQRLKNVQKVAGGYMACCPAHTDYKPSLKISLAPDGKVLLKCFADCATEEIVRVLGLEMSDLFPPKEHYSAPPGQVAATYEYRHADGTLLYQVQRKKPKGFVQRRPDGNDGWIWNTEGVKKVLYLLPSLLAAKPEKPVYIAEGEKDVNSLVALGMVATCNVGGAGKWLDSYSETLRGRHCIILPDNDEPGRKHAALVAQSLHQCAASIKIVELPGLPERGDVSDWIDSGGTAEALQALADATSEADISSFSRFSNIGKERNENTGNVKGFRFSTIGEMLAEPEQEVSYLVDGLLPSGGIAIMVAKPKVGKTTTVRQLCLAIARGEPFLGRDVKQGPVVYLALEEKRSGVVSHFRDMGATDEPIYIHVGAAPQDALYALAAAIEEHHPVLAIIDPLLRFVRVKDVNDYAIVTQAMEPIVELARNSGCCLLCIHHMNKMDKLGDSGDSVLGSTALFAAVDTLLIMKRRDETRTIETLQRYGADMPTTVLVMDAVTRNIGVGGDFETMQLDTFGKQILQALADGPLAEAEIKDQVKGNTGLCGKALRKLCVEGLVERTGGGKRGDPFRYALVATNSAAAWLDDILSANRL